MSDKRIQPSELGEAIEQELTVYAEEINEGLSKVVTDSMKKLVKRTKETAPTGKRNGQFRANIAADYSALRKRGVGGRNIAATWYVKPPDHRLTHLIVKGHATKDGGRTRANPFLQKALDEVLPEYEREVEEVLKNDK